MAKSGTKYVTTKYGTKINVTGLTPEQTKKVLATAQDKGAYGAKGAALADTFRKQAAKAGPAVTKPTPMAPTTPTTGTPAALNEGDISGNTKQSFVAGYNGNPIGDISLTGAPQIYGAQDLQGDANAARAGAYSYITQDYATQKQQEMENAKQELAQRGIPLDPSPDSLYGRTLSQIDKKYQGLDDQAKNQAYGLGNDTMQTQSTVSSNAYNAFLSGAQAVSNAELQNYGITQNSSDAEKQLAMQKIIADRQNKSQEKIAANQNATAIRIKRLGMQGGGGGSNTDPLVATTTAPNFGG